MKIIKNFLQKHMKHQEKQRTRRTMKNIQIQTQQHEHQTKPDFKQ
jgi:hypothetical protein